MAIDFNTYRKKYCSPITGREQARKMWTQYLEVAEASTDIKKDEMKSDFVMSNGSWGSLFVQTFPISVSTDYPKAVECTVPAQKKEKTMYVDNDKHLESSKINYLSDRVSSIVYRKADEMLKTFGLTDDAAPTSATEFVKRIQDGKFIFKDEKNKDTKGYYYRPIEGIRWRDPAVKEDKDGYDAAMKTLDGLKKDAMDTIAILTPAEGLAAVKALEAWTPTVGKA